MISEAMNINTINYKTINDNSTDTKLLISDKAVEIRKAKYDDINAIQEITKEAFLRYIKLTGLENTIEALQETYDDIKKDIKNKEVFIAFLDEIPVGSARVEIFPDKTAYFSRFGVKNDYQSIGVGKEIMNMVDITMKNKGVKRMYLHTASKVSSLIRFYYARGFYIESTSTDRGYLRALLCKEYE
jgi:N-acetylglutamate synthase-like GNAT family acetyltransferase